MSGIVWTDTDVIRAAAIWRAREHDVALRNCSQAAVFREIAQALERKYFQVEHRYRAFGKTFVDRRQRDDAEQRVHWDFGMCDAAADVWRINITDLYDPDDVPPGLKQRVIGLIAERLSLTVKQVYDRYNKFGPTFSGIKIEGASERALIERERRRAAAELRDLTATTFGDPPPGYSALDRLRAQAQR